MQLIKKHPLAVLATVIVMFLVFFGYRLFGESAKVVDVVLFTVFSAALLILPAMELGDEILKLLRNMEPKTGTGSGSVNAIEPYRQRSQREDLEQSLVHALAPGLVSGMTGAEIGKYIRESADAIMGSAQNRFVGQGACYAAKVHDYAAKVGDLLAKTANCTCGPADRCNNCPTPSAQADQRIEAAKASGQYAAQLEAGAMSELHVSASVRPADIEASIEVETYFTAANGAIDAGEPYHDALELLTFCVLVLRNGTKVVGINHGAIDPAQHSAECGRQKARTQAVDKLRELEGYALHSKLTTAAAQ